MIASEALRADIANARLNFERAVKRLKEIEKIIADLATDDIVLFFCPRPECRTAFNISLTGLRMVCPPHDCSATGKVCQGTFKPFDIRYITAEAFAASDPLGVKETKRSGVKEEIDTNEAHEVAELERL